MANMQLIEIPYTGNEMHPDARDYFDLTESENKIADEYETAGYRVMIAHEVSGRRKIVADQHPTEPVIFHYLAPCESL